MAHLSPDSPMPARRKRRWVAGPALLALAATAIAGYAVFPTLPGAAVALAGLAWASAALSALALRGQPSRPASDVDAPRLVDPETGLGTRDLLEETLYREIARTTRYGSPLALALLEIEVTGFTPTEAGELPPSPAPFVAKTLVNLVRDSDTVMRLDQRSFAVVLVESDGDGGQALVRRVLTELGRTPYARNADGTGIYAHGIGGAVAWRAEIQTPEQFLAAAAKALEEYHHELAIERSWFSGRREQGPGLPPHIA